MGTRLELQEELEGVLGSKNVYFQPPETIKMKYDAIVYDFSTMVIRRANDKPYIKVKGYDLTVISRNPDNNLVNDLLDHFLHIRFNRRYKADNLYHDSLTLYY